MINQSIKEITSQWDYTFLETTKSYPFYHVISGVQAVQFTTGGIFFGTEPYPRSVLTYSQTAAFDPRDVTNNFSGISYTGYLPGDPQPYGLHSTSGTPTTMNWSGVGYTYQLDEDIDKILAPGIVIMNSVSGNTAKGIIEQATEWEDITRLIPIGVINASGTPCMYMEAPGLGPQNGKSVQFFPFPTPDYASESFVVPYKKKHVDLVNSTDQQTVIPEQWQEVILYGALEKIFEISDDPKSDKQREKKEELIAKMKVWDANQPAKMRHWRDYNLNNKSNFMYDNSTWLTLGEGLR